MMIERTIVRGCSVSEIMEDPAFPALSLEYEAESKIEGMPSPSAKMGMYLEMDGVGMLHPIGAWRGAELVGFLAILTPRLPRYGALVAVVESFFVAACHRKSGAGLRLLKAAEMLAAEAGSPGIFVSSPVSGMLVEILPRRGYTESSRIFFKKVP